MRYLFILFLLSAPVVLLAQKVEGMLTGSDGKPVSFANIGVLNRNLGTVSSIAGYYELDLSKTLPTDTLQVSCIGYETKQVIIGEFLNRDQYNLTLPNKTYSLEEVIISPRKYKERILGVTTQSKTVSAGFKDKNLGYQMGIIMRNRKRAVLQEVYLNIAYNSYDTIFYRLNIFEVKGRNDFVNVLREPIYITLTKEQVGDKITIDLETYDIVVEGNFLIAVELVKDLGEGELLFCAGFGKSTVYQYTSQGGWSKVPVGVSISVKALIEK